ncbi:MAG TPA: hypothetical protein VMQ76_09415 [Terracidiphilus sp.]|nr:hypothetical protein [Terracidiphilus sp.]
MKVFTAFFTNRKTIRLRSLIGDSALWLPIRLWAYAAENQQDGDFSGYSEHEVAMLVGYSGDASSMLQALHKAGFMEDGKIHGWEEYNEYHAEFKARAKLAADTRWEKHRAKKEKKQKKDTGEESIGAKQCLGHASSMQEICDFVLTLGLPVTDGQYFWEKWQGNGNQNAGKSIKDWKSVIRSWKLAGYCPSQKQNGNGAAQPATRQPLRTVV